MPHRRRGTVTNEDLAFDGPGSAVQREGRCTASGTSERRRQSMADKLTGSFVALITPFNKDGSVDFAAFRTLLDFQAKHGTSTVLIMGSTGETSMLSPEEKKKIIIETAKMKTQR